MNGIESSAESITNHRDIVRTRRMALSAIVVAAGATQLYLAIHYFGFLTGDDVEVLAEAFRVATGFRYRAWDIRNLFVPDFVVAPFIYLGTVAGISDVRALGVLAAVPFMACHATSTVLVRNLAHRLLRDERVSLAAAALFAFHWIPLGFGSTVYPRTLATAAILGACYLLLTRAGALASVAAGLLVSLAFADRFSEGVFLIPLMLVARRRAGWLLAGFVSGTVVTIGWYDFVTWGEWFGSLRKFAHLTLVESDFSSRVKHQSSLWYLLTLPRWLSLFMIPLVWAALRRRDLRADVLMTATFVFIPLVVFSLIAHKEIRYLEGVIPWIVLLASMGIERFRRPTAIAILGCCLIWQLYGLNLFARKSMPAVTAARALGRDESVRTVAMSQLWAYGDRLYFGDRMEVVDVGIPPVRLREGLHADAVCLYDTSLDATTEKLLRDAGFHHTATYRASRARTVVVYRRDR